MLKRSPSGSLCPYYYRGGELHPLHYGSFHRERGRLFTVMAAEEDFILHSAGRHNRRIWIDLYETRLDDAVIAALVRHIEAIRQKIFRICLVGCPTWKRLKIRCALRRTDRELAVRLRFFSDPEKAKQWLVSEGG